MKYIDPDFKTQIMGKGAKLDHSFKVSIMQGMLNLNQLGLFM